MTATHRPTEHPPARPIFVKAEMMIVFLGELSNGQQIHSNSKRFAVDAFDAQRLKDETWAEVQEFVQGNFADSAESVQHTEDPDHG